MVLNENKRKEKSFVSRLSYEELMIEYQKALQEIKHLKFLEQEGNQKIAKFYAETLEEIRDLKFLLQKDKNKTADFAKEITRLYEEAIQAIQHLKSLLQQDKDKLTNLEEEVARLKEQINLMQHKIFGKKSEIHIGEPINTEDELQVVPSYTRKKGKKSRGRLVDTSNLLRYKVYHDLPELEQICKSCNNHLVKIGEYVSEQLEIFPAKLYVVEHIRYRYSCPCCKTIIMAPKPMAPIPKSLSGGSLITEIIVNKYQHHLPLYRQSKMLANYNVLIPDNTLGNLVMLSGTGLMPIYEACWQAITSTDYLQVDEIPVKILKPNTKGYLWTYFAPLVGQKGLVVYEIALSRESEVAQKRLANFKGLLQTDGYSGYIELKDREDITGVGCMSHGRRKFDDVLKITKNKEGIAAEVINRLKPIYALEQRMREAGISFHTRKRLRQKYAKPLLYAIRTWLKQIKSKVPPKSKLMVAIQYLLNQWPYLIAYLRHGKVEIDNNWIENKNRPIALGKHNWLFMGSKDSGTINAMWYTLIQSALLNNLNPRVYIHYLLTQTHAIRKNTVDVTTLLPHTINHAILQKFAQEQMALTKEVFNSVSTSAQDIDFAFINIFNNIGESTAQPIYAGGYNICLMSELPLNGQPEPNKIYIKEQKGKLWYIVLSFNKEKIEGELFKGYLNETFLNDKKFDILKIILSREHNISKAQSANIVNHKKSASFKDFSKKASILDSS